MNWSTMTWLVACGVLGANASLAQTQNVHTSSSARASQNGLETGGRNVIPITGVDASPPPLRPAIIAEPVAAPILLGGQKTKYYIVAENVAYPIDADEAVALAGDAEAAWQIQVAPVAAGVVMTPFISIGVLTLAVGMVFGLTVGLLGAVEGTVVRPEQAFAGLGVVAAAALVGTAVSAAGILGGMWVGELLGPDAETLESLDNVQYIDAGTLPAVLAERHCVLSEAE